MLGEANSSELKHAVKIRVAICQPPSEMGDLLEIELTSWQQKPLPLAKLAVLQGELCAILPH